MCYLRLEMKIAIESAYIESSVVWFDPIAMCCRAYTERSHNKVWLHSTARCFNVLCCYRVEPHAPALLI